MKVVFWDWNGTIINDALVLSEVFSDIIEARGHNRITLEEYRELYTHPSRLMYEAVGMDLQQHSFDQIGHDWHTNYLARVPSINLHHDSVAALEAIKSRGCRQFVLSAFPEKHLGGVVRDKGIADYFERIVGHTGLLGHGKVDEALTLMKELGVAGSEVTLVGDSSHDAEVAQAIEADCVLVARGAESRARLERHGFTVIDSFEPLISTFKAV